MSLPSTSESGCKDSDRNLDSRQTMCVPKSENFLIFVQLYSWSFSRILDIGQSNENLDGDYKEKSVLIFKSQFSTS